MKLQTIRSLNGEAEYVLVPFSVYQALKDEIEEELQAQSDDNDYVPFELTDYVDNPVALARIRARITQQELAGRMGVSQAYVSKIEQRDRVTPQLLERVHQAMHTSGGKTDQST